MGSVAVPSFLVLQEVETRQDADRDVEAKASEAEVSSSSKHGSSGEMVASRCLACFN